MSARPVADAPPSPVPGTVRGPKSCLLMVLLTSLLGFGGIGLGWYLFQRKNAAVLSSAEDLAAILARAPEAPGADAVRALGCDEAGAIDTADLVRIAQHLEAEEAKKKGRATRPVDLGVRDTVVYCARRAAEGSPTCEEAARGYAGTAKPVAPFVVTVRAGESELCAARFSAAAAPLGSAPSPNLPPLLPR
jgi:hypothetical protein